VRTDEGVFGLLYAVRIARVDLDHRVEQHAPVPLVSDLYGDEELPFRGGFKVTPEDARSRWDRGEVELSRAAVLLGVASLDELLGAVINLLRVVGKDETEAGTTQTGVSDKLGHLTKYGGLSISDGTIRLYDVCLAIRNSVAHHGSQQKPLADAWRRLKSPEQKWWEGSAGRVLS
jgi:hypothetical protein